MEITKLHTCCIYFFLLVELEPTIVFIFKVAELQFNYEYNLFKQKYR